MTLPDHGSVYDGLLGGDESQWAFGTGPDAPSAGDPLAGMDLGVPDGVGLGAHGGLALQGQPAGPVDLAEHRDAALVGVDRLLRTAGRDDARDVRLGIEGETDGHDVR